MGFPFASTQCHSRGKCRRIHAASAEVLMIEQHTTLSLALLSRSGPDGEVEEAAHPTPEKGHHNTLLETESRVQNSFDSSWMQ